LVQLGLPVLIVPGGSGNDFARALGLPKVHDSVSAWQKFCGGAMVRAIDLGVITALGNGNGPSAPQQQVSRYFCCIAGVGLDGDVARRANQWPRWLRRHGGYVLSLAPTILSFAPFPMRVETPDVGDDKTWLVRSDQPTILAAFANTPTYGGGMKIAPRAQMDDGVLDVCVVGGVSPFKLLRMFPSVYSGRHLKIREVSYFQTGRARIETAHPRDVYADGEFVCRTPVGVGVQRAALKVVTG
jgi:diacylglycerol kinase family enzyme